MNEIVKILKAQYEDSYKTLRNLVEFCPDELWKADNHGVPVWNNVIHALIGSDFWLRLDYFVKFESSFSLPDNLGEKLLQDEWCTEDDGFMTKEQVMECFKEFDVKKDKFFDSLKDEMLCQKIRDDMDFTYLDVICAQMKHIMCHVGMCEDAMIAFGGEEAPLETFEEN